MQMHEEKERTERLAHVIASAGVDGITYTPAMRVLLDRVSRGEISEAEFDREAEAVARGQE